jgi:hypothetical protein
LLAAAGPDELLVLDATTLARVDPPDRSSGPGPIGISFAPG